jgi:membrane peptidoglycan carboxypeptidase
MTARGPAWEGDPAAARLGYDPQTAPLPYGVTSGDPYRDTAPYPDQDPGDYRPGDYRPGGYGPGGYGPDGDGWDRTRWRRPGRGRRLLRRLVAVLVALLLLGGVTFGVLYLATPSVHNAPALARAIDHAHHVAYPGPPVPALFAESLVATEDHRFYSEPGIDVFAVARVAAATVTGHGAAQGGATLYQQLAKMLYTPGASGLPTEVEQVMLGIKLDQAYSKAQILRMYADVAYFGHGYYGLAAASCGYFGTAPAGLTLPEAATLAGLVQGPSADDPIAHYARGRAREAHVLGRLAATGKITTAQSAAAYAQGLHLVGGTGRGCPS